MASNSSARIRLLRACSPQLSMNITSPVSLLNPVITEAWPGAFSAVGQAIRSLGVSSGSLAP